MILVTGGTGLVGSHLLFELTMQPNRIRAIFRSEVKRKMTENFFLLLDKEHGAERFLSIEWVHMDLTDCISLADAFKDVEYVYHCAGLVSFNNSRHTELFKMNREATFNVVNCCLDFKVKKLCYVSSTAAIGGKPGELVSENTKWNSVERSSSYALSKNAAEREVWRAKEEGLSVVIVNPTVIFGAGEWAEGSLAIFRTVSKGLNFYSPGTNGFVDARDVVKIMTRLMHSDIEGQRFLLVGSNCSFQELTTEIARKLQIKAPVYRAPRFGAELAWRCNWLWYQLSGVDPMLSKSSVRSAYAKMQYSNQKIKDTLGYAFYSLEDTIAYTVNFRLN